MPRANRHYVSGQVWHITHRCHDRRFLLKFAIDRWRWLHWLVEAKKRFELSILDYIVTSNHIHMLIFDKKGQDNLSRSIQLIAGRVGQEYNIRKERKGAFWEDRYHATMVESGTYLMQCIAYIDLNMVRAGAITHPGEWQMSGYSEIHNRRGSYKVIDYSSLIMLSGCCDLEEFRTLHKSLIEERLQSGKNIQDSRWTQSVAIGSQDFVEKIKKQLGWRGRGREINSKDGVFELKEVGRVAYGLNWILEESDTEIHVLEGKNVHPLW